MITHRVSTYRIYRLIKEKNFRLFKIFGCSSF